eukprot:CAMPEP_0206600874 /NCGR_PEP_ID=MMETSP0325_2-20121206/46147_1 /ASSEMBLY_ACC=CAM_ASM_000347 /TAXON_ID=2866 /ORGANISM="Crypthecodinium cohnii, Strain Seligo" /LENGTH=483 /DNA_ID=CAMNT_0054112445 /DNA_START=162 /DNA_END=1613 /DNA_ORIENTATION=-
MVMMADEHYISRASLLFSVMDLAGSGVVGSAELGLGLRAILLGLSRIARHFNPPAVSLIAGWAEELYRQIAPDVSGITCGMFVCFAYKSGIFRALCDAFPSAKTTIMEEEIRLLRRKPPAKTEICDATLRHRLRVTPDESRWDFLISPWREKSPQGSSSSSSSPPHLLVTISRTHAWLLVNMYDYLAKGRRGLPTQEVLALLKDHGKLKSELEIVVQQASKAEIIPPDAHRVFRHFYGHLADERSLTSIESMLENQIGVVSLRALCCVVWPQTKESEVERCLSWCQHIKAARVLNKALPRTQDKDFIFEIDDFYTIFNILDRNGRETVPLAELFQKEVLDKSLVLKIMNRLEHDRTSFVAKTDLNAIFQQLVAAVQQQLRFHWDPQKPQRTPRTSLSPSANGKLAAAQEGAGKEEAEEGGEGEEGAGEAGASPDPNADSENPTEPLGSPKSSAQSDQRVAGAAEGSEDSENLDANANTGIGTK